MMEPRNPNSSSTRSTFRQPYTTFRPWNLQRLNQAAQNEHQRQQQRSPQLYSNDELIIKIPNSVQSMSPISPTRLPPTPVSEGSKTAEIPSFATYGIQSPLDSQTSEDAPPPLSSSRLPVTTTTEVTTWASPSNDAPHNDDIHFADQRHEPWFEKTPSFNVCSAVRPPSPQHSTDRLALRATTTITTTTTTAAAAPTSALNHYPSTKHDENRKVSSKMYSDHIDQWRPISPPSNNHHSLPSTHYPPTPASQQRNNNNPWSSAILVDSWEGFHSFAQTVKPTSVMKFPKRYRLPEQDDDTLQVRDEEQQHMDTQVDNDYQQQQDEDQQQQPLSSGSSDQYEDAMSSPPKSDYDAQEQDNILMVFDDLGPDQPTKENKSHDDKVDEEDDDEGDWVYSSKLGEQSTHTIRRYSRDELMDMKPESNQDNVLGQGAKQRINNFIDARQSAKRHVKVHISRTPREPPVNGDDIGFQPGIPPPMQSNNVTMYIDL